MRQVGMRVWVYAMVLGFAVLPAGAESGPDRLLHGTFSLCAIDPETGESGAVVTTRVPFVGRAVPWVRAGVGAVATQSWTVVEYGPQGLDRLAEGIEPSKVIRQLLEGDEGREHRQLGLIDMRGRTAAFTGSENSAWAGSRQGKNYTVQGNILVGREVIDAVADHFESTAGTGMPLAERMVLALEAGQKQGGDRRWGEYQSAAIRIADPNDPGRGGDHLSLKIDVGEHAHPIGEMKRIYYTTAGRLGYRSFSATEGSDVVELKRMLQATGYWREDVDRIPEGPEFDVDRNLMRSDPARFFEKVQEFREVMKRFREAYGKYDDETVQAVDRFREDHGLDHSGHPRGLVDAALVEALREAYYSTNRDAAEKR